jgi:hypothetical protein
MEPIYDIQGKAGLLRVWNTTKGYLEVTEEGYLLQGETSAWIEETDAVVDLIKEGLLVVVGGQESPSVQEASESPKKKKSSTISQSSTEVEDLPAADEAENKKEAEEPTSPNNDVSVETV